MKKLSSAKKLLLSAFGLVLMMTFAVSTTLAWFTMSEEADVTEFELTAKSGEGTLLISLSQAGEYRTSVDLEGDSTYGEMIAKVKLADITWDGSAFKNVETQNVAAPTTAGGSYFQFTLYFRSTNKDKTAVALVAAEPTDSYLKHNTTNGIYTKAWTDLSAADYGTEYLTGASLVTHAANAARVMFAGATRTIWEPNSTLGFAAGTRNIAQDYRDYIMGNTPAVTPEVPNYGSATLFKDTAIDGEKLLTLTETASGTEVYEGSLTISIWLEGKDKDCFNSILSDTFLTAFKFVSIPA